MFVGLDDLVLLLTSGDAVSNDEGMLSLLI